MMKTRTSLNFSLTRISYKVQIVKYGIFILITNSLTYVCDMIRISGNEINLKI